MDLGLIRYRRATKRLFLYWMDYLVHLLWSDVLDIWIAEWFSLSNANGLRH